MAPPTARRPEPYRRSLWILDPLGPDRSRSGSRRVWALYAIPVGLLVVGGVLLLLGTVLWSDCAPTLPSCPPPANQTTQCAALALPGECLHAWVLPSATVFVAGLVTFPISNWVHRRYRRGPRPPAPGR
jgi:hypothetical protein